MIESVNPVSRMFLFIHVSDLVEVDKILDLIIFDALRKYLQVFHNGGDIFLEDG